MGLDQYGYVVRKSDTNTDFYFDEDNTKSLLFCDWRKHPNLEGWMEKLFNQKADIQGYDNGMQPCDNVTISMTDASGKEFSAGKDTVVANGMEEIVKSIQEAMIEQSFKAAGSNRVFNNQLIRLNLSDIDQLEMHIKNKTLPPTTGFFFGDNADEEYMDQDLKFIQVARVAINQGYDVYYRSSW
jgi:hypothetical protein